MTNKLLKELMDLPLTDFGNALRLQAIFGKRWVYLPRFKSWMYRDQYSWKGKRTRDICYAVTAAFRHLAQDIDRLPMPKAEWEREERTETVPGYAAGGGSGAGRSAEGELDCVKYVWIVLIEYCLS